MFPTLENSVKIDWKLSVDSALEKIKEGKYLIKQQSAPSVYY